MPATSSSLPPSLASVDIVDVVDVHSLFLPRWDQSLLTRAPGQTSLDRIVDISNNAEDFTRGVLQRGRVHVGALAASLDLLVGTRNIINARLETATNEADRAKKTAESRIVQTYIEAGTAIMGRSLVRDMLMSF